MIYLISGVPGCGKSSVSQKLAKHFGRSYLIEADIIRNFVISGYSSPANWNDETKSQFELSATNVCALANNAQKLNFEVIIDDAVSKDQQQIYFQLLPKAIKIFLYADLEEILQRNRNRDKHVDESLIRDVYQALIYRKDSDQWHSIDTTRIDIDATIEKILKLPAPV